MTGTPAQHRDRERLRGHLASSQDAVWKVARYFYDSGWSVTMTAYPAFGSYENRMADVDNGDLYLRSRNAWARVEVKRRNLSFTDRWPHPTIFVCAQHSWDRAEPKPALFIYLNREMTHYAYLLPHGTRQYWRVKKVHDKRYEAMDQDTYEVDREHVKFGSFAEPWKV